MLKHVLNYLSVSVFAVLLGIVSIPILTHLLTPREYGSYHTFIALVAISNILFTLNFHTGISRYWYEEKEDKPAFITLSLFGSFVILAIFTSIVYSSKTLQTIMGIEYTWIKYLILLVLINIFISVYSQILVPQRKSKRQAVFSIVKIYTSFGLGLLLIYVLPYSKAESLILAQVIVGVLLVIFILKEIRQYMTVAFSNAHTSYILKYTGPLFFYSISAILMAQIDRLMLTNILSSAHTGLYSLAFIVANFFSMFMGAVMTAWTPNYFEDMNNEKYFSIKEGIKKIIDIAFLIATFIILFGDYIGYVLVDDKFNSALKYIPFIVIGLYLSLIYQLYGRAIGYAKKTIWIAIIFIIAGIVNFLFNNLLIAQYGISGAIFATLVANVLLAIGGYLVNKFILKYNDYIISYGVKVFFILSILVFIKSFLEFRSGIMIYFAEISLFFCIVIYLMKKNIEEIVWLKEKYFAYIKKKL